MNLRIGYKDFKLSFGNIFETHGEDLRGIVFNNKGLILIDESISDIEKANVMMHEVMHSVFHVHGMDKMGIDDDTEERIINSLCNGMTQVFRDNPEFAILVMEKLGYNVIRG